MVSDMYRMAVCRSTIFQKHIRIIYDDAVAMHPLMNHQTCLGMKSVLQHADGIDY